MLRSLSALLIVVLLLFGKQGICKADTKGRDTLYITEDFREVSLGAYVRYLSDSTNQMSLEDFLEQSSPTEATLRINAREEVILGYTQNQHWAQFKVFNTLPDTQFLYLSVAYPNLDHFYVFERFSHHQQDSIRLMAKMGDNFRNGNKLVSHRNYVVPLSLPPGEARTYIMQIRKQWEPVNFPLILSNEFNFVRRSNNDNLFLGLYFGIHFTFALLLITLYFFTGNSFFVLYFSLNLLYIFNLLSDTGLGLQHIWTEVPVIQKVLPYVVTFGTIVIHITFVRQFFSTALHFGRYNQFLLGLLGLALFTLIALTTFAFIFPGSNLPFQIGYNVINGLYLGYGLVIVSLCGVAYYQVRRPEIIWVLMVISIQYVSWVMNILVRGNAFPSILKGFDIYELNLFASHIATPHVIILILLLEIIVVSFVLSVNFYSFIKDNSTGEFRLLLMQRKTINAYIEGQEKERQHLAGRINESVLEDVALLKEQMTAALARLSDPVLRAKVLQLSEETGSIENSIRRISQNFIPSDYLHKSFYEAIRHIFQPLQASGVKVRFDLAVPSPLVNDFSKVNLCRILQEIAGNINKHAQARQVHVKLTYRQELKIEISDDGKGFERRPGKGGIGLLNIESRVKGLNGTFDIESREGKGTRFFITIPMEELR